MSPGETTAAQAVQKQPAMTTALQRHQIAIPALFPGYATNIGYGVSKTGCASKVEGIGIIETEEVDGRFVTRIITSENDTDEPGRQIDPPLGTGPAAASVPSDCSPDSVGNDRATLKPPTATYPESAIETIKRMCNGESVPFDEAFKALREAKRYEGAIDNHAYYVSGAIRFADRVFWGHPIEMFCQYQVSSRD